MGEEFNIIQFLKSAVATGASDEHLQVGYVPYIRKNGYIKKTNLQPLSKEDLERAIRTIIPPELLDDVLTKFDIDFMYEIEGCSRFRINYNRQMGMPCMVIRNIPYEIPSMKKLSLPDALDEIIGYLNGIILVTGPTGSGKSTTLASMINEISLKNSKHIITIEDPVEYVYASQKSLISQRQVEIDTASFADGVKYALRQDPDIIFIGEIRDKETMEAALKASETGHLVFSTLHTNDAIQTINRIINMFEESTRDLVRKRLAETLRATIAQKLVYSQKNKKRYPACEIMVVTPAIKDYIIKDKTDDIYELLDDSSYDSMISMNLSLASLVETGLITEAEALEHSNNQTELEQIFRGAYQGSKAYYE